MNKKTIFEGRVGILLFLRGSQTVFEQFWKLYWSKNNEQKESRVYTVNQLETPWTAKKFKRYVSNKCYSSKMWNGNDDILSEEYFKNSKTRRGSYLLREMWNIWILSRDPVPIMPVLSVLQNKTELVTLVQNSIRYFKSKN